MLPSFFAHYDPIVDQYFIYDDGSVDGSLEILEAHPRVTVQPFERSVPDSFVFSELALSNEAWKASRGSADWVIVTDVDEHLWHEDLPTYLRHCTKAGVTLIPALGFQMLSESPPRTGADLCEAGLLGAPWDNMMKPSIFDPSAISEIGYEPGRHAAHPQGVIAVPERDEVLLLHYKYLGFEATLQRHRELYMGLGPGDHERQFGHKYSWSEDRLRSDWIELARSALDPRAHGYDPSTYPLPRWWERYRGARPLPALP